MPRRREPHQGDPEFDRIITANDFDAMTEGQTILRIFGAVDSKTFCLHGIYLRLFGPADALLLQISLGGVSGSDGKEFIPEIPLEKIRQIYRLSPEEIVRWLNDRSLKICYPGLLIDGIKS